MKKEWDPVKLLSHSRHDWLNKIQLIKGNLSLNKVERAEEIIEEIIFQARQESKLTNLKLPNVALLILTYNWESQYIQLEFEVLDETMEIPHPLNDEFIAEWISSFLQLLNSTVKPFSENHLSITIDVQEERLRFFFDFRGIIMKREPIEAFLQNTSSLELKIHDFTDDEISIEAHLPRELAEKYLS